MEKLDMNALRTNAREFADSVRTYKDDARDHAELLLQKLKLQEYIQEKKEDERLKKTILIVLAIIGCVATVAGIAYAVYRFMMPDYLEDYDDFEDDADDFEDED